MLTRIDLLVNASATSDVRRPRKPRWTTKAAGTFCHACHADPAPATRRVVLESRRVEVIGGERSVERSAGRRQVQCKWALLL